MTLTMRRRFAALPDAAASAVFLWAWLRPLAWLRELVGLLVLALMIEFVVIQAGPFIGTILYGARMGLSLRERRQTAIVLGATYLGFAAIAALSFDAWFPALLFAWLLGAKLLVAVLGYNPQALGREREMAFWMIAVMVYLAAVFGAMVVPVPPLGVTADGALYGLRGRYEWANYPYEATAAGFVYFAAMALLRFFNLRFGLDPSEPGAPEALA